MSRNKMATAAIGVHLSLCAAPALALKFELFGTPIQLNNLATTGAVIRMQDRDSTLVGKPNLAPGLCIRPTGQNADGEPTFEGNGCTGTADNLRYVNSPGAFSVNGDDGNLNFDKYDVAYATTKLTSDLFFDAAGFSFFARGLALYDGIYSDFSERRPDTTIQPARERYSKAGRDINGINVRLQDAFVLRSFEVADRPVVVKAGQQAINWGESSFLVSNSLNSINAPSVALLRLPGFDVKELFQPQGMVSINAELAPGINTEAFYQYQWLPVEIDPVGSYFSTTDSLGPGGDFILLTYGKQPEDPLGLYQPANNPDDAAFLLGSKSSRTIYRDYEEERRRRPSDGGQFGANVKVFLEEFNGGTEIGFYFANYHSRVPILSLTAADDTCLPQTNGITPLDNILTAAVSCGALDPNDPAATQQFLAETLPALLSGNAQLVLPRETTPFDTVRYFAEYPENIRMFGVSFNTTVGDFAWSGEYVFRPNLPLQVSTVDLTIAALNPVLPQEDIDFGITVVPGRRASVPDFVVTNYRGAPVVANQYIQGYERMKVGQFGTSLIRTIGGDNFLGASQISLLLELGLTHVIDMPKLDELQFQGSGGDTPISSGADGSVGINPRDVRTDPNDPSTNRFAANTRGTPTAVSPSFFATDVSYGYRVFTSARYDNAFLGVNVEPIVGIFHDVKGVTPNPGGNFIEGRKQFLGILRMDYLNKFNGELRYTWFTGGGLRDQLRDRDNLSFFVGYQF